MFEPMYTVLQTGFSGFHPCLCFDCETKNIESFFAAGSGPWLTPMVCCCHPTSEVSSSGGLWPMCLGLPATTLQLGGQPMSRGSRGKVTRGDAW